MAAESIIERTPCYCAMCVSRCGAIAVTDNGRFVALEPDPAHPTGQALCAKGRAAPEIVYHADRLHYPLKRTRPKTDADPGWQRISWEEALDTTAEQLKAIAARHGAHSVVFSIASPSTSASSDSVMWMERLMRAYGSPNLCGSMELCGWGRYGATVYTYGSSVPGVYMPDLERAGCILFWGYNPSLARLVHAVHTTSALKRGARLIVVDPRRTGPASRADVWLRVRPGTDAALALGITRIMLERGWYDRDFVRNWTNAPLLVRNDDGRLLTARDLDEDGDPQHFFAWNERALRVTLYDAATGTYADDVRELALSGEVEVATSHGKLRCRPVFDLLAASCAPYDGNAVQAICGIAGTDVERAAHLLWHSRPVAYYAWSGVEMQTGATQIARAIAQLYALTGSFDQPGGNVQFAGVPANGIAGEELLSPEQHARTLGLRERPLGPARWNHITSDDLYRAVLERKPYPVHGVVGFGANLLLAHCDSARGRDALAALDFFVHADLFMTPTANLADIVLPVSSPFEREALRIGFEVSPEAAAHVQLRPRIAPPQGEARADIDIVFDLAQRLGLGAHFFDGDIAAAYEHQLAPSGITLAMLRAQPRGVRAPVTTRHQKFADATAGGVRGFATTTRKIELYSETLLLGGHPPLPAYEPPLVSAAARPDLAESFPLVLTCAKHVLFCETQHRGLASLRRHAPEPEVEMHPNTAAARGINEHDWVRLETPAGSVRARARFNAALEETVVCGQHGWWQECRELNLPGYDPFSHDGANFNLIITNDAVDPVAGSVPHRAYVCQLSPLS